ncbi:MAG: hypothetical protein ACOYL6_10205 [Bacteriovoracaceae bacterium]
MHKICFLLLGLFLIPTLAIASNKPSKDWAVFKLAEDVYFTSDLVPLYLDFYTFHCAYEDAVLFKMINLDFSKIERELMEKIDTEATTPFSSERKVVWQELKKVLKLSIYVSQAKVVMKETLPKEIMALAKASNCKNRGKLAEKNFEKFLKIEIFLKSRFNNRFFSDSKEATKKDFKIDERKGNEKMIEAMDAFFKTIERQINHEDLF